MQPPAARRRPAGATCGGAVRRRVARDPAVGARAGRLLQRTSPPRATPRRAPGHAARVPQSPPRRVDVLTVRGSLEFVLPSPWLIRPPTHVRRSGYLCLTQA